MTMQGKQLGAEGLSVTGAGGHVMQGHCGEGHFQQQQNFGC